MNSVDEIADWLRTRPGKVRLVGSGSRRRYLPPSAGAKLLDVGQLHGIVRLDAEDQTCTVECGLPRTELDAALAEHNVELPCLGAGTIGGLFAHDPFGSAGPTAPSPRSLLLGMEGLLADGTRFRSGARVVKSVAGFDVHKLLVGSNGRLFIATRLHLRLQPQPRTEQWFHNEDLDRDRALALLRELRLAPLPPAVLQLRRERDGSFAIAGRVTGRAVHTNAMVHRYQLQPSPARSGFHIDAGNEPTGEPTEEVLHGQVLASALPQLLDALPQAAPLTWLAGGRFEVAIERPETVDELLRRLPEVPATAMLAVCGEHRRGRGTTLHAGEQRLADAIKQALDPDGVLV